MATPDNERSVDRADDHPPDCPTCGGQGTYIDRYNEVQDCSTLPTSDKRPNGEPVPERFVDDDAPPDDCAAYPALCPALQRAKAEIQRLRDVADDAYKRPSVPERLWVTFNNDGEPMFAHADEREAAEAVRNGHAMAEAVEYVRCATDPLDAR